MGSPIWVLEAQKDLGRAVQAEGAAQTEAAQRGRKGYGKELGSLWLWQPLSQVGVGAWGWLWTSRKIGLDSLGLSNISDLLLKGKPLPWVSRTNWILKKQNDLESGRVEMCIFAYVSFFLSAI